ncbi:MAG: glycoside hydrolase family 3 C-terminal domain-containing protein [Sandaracinaceae bacterium]|nr:glycoside hydrolase family 3 C-terminal domain-containing protein [Sandaracinaceae bacterium]
MRLGWWGLACAVALGACDGGGGDAGTMDGGAPAVDAARDYVPEPFEPTAETRAYCAGDDDAIEARITTLLGQLSVAEKIALMHGVGTAVVERTWLVEGNEAYGIPGLHMLDGPRGLSAFTEANGTAFPVGMMRGATWDPALEERVGAAMAREIQSVGADVLLAPTINILRHPRWGRAQETYSEDVHHLGAMGVGFILGVQSEGVIASVKHYAANSIEDTRHTVDVTVDERTLREIYLPHFRRAVQDARAGSVMSAYNQVNGLYCDLNGHLLTDILRDEWGFAGFVESDWILGTHGDGESVTAGLDIEMPSPTEFRFMQRALAAGEITEPDLDDAVRHILRAQFCFGLDTRERVLDDPSARETAEHLALAREVATRGIVLLRNEAGALPLAPTASVVVVGRNADVENIGDEGSSDVSSSEVITALEGLAAQGTSVTHLTSSALSAADEATVAAADAVVVVTGLTSDDEGEADIGAGDREDLLLPAAEIALIEAVAALNPRVIVVLEGGSAILVEGWVDDVEAIVHAFYPGSQGGHAIADVLFGVEAPAGRLPFSVPTQEADLPPFDNTSPGVTYGYFHGYRHLDNEGLSPRYPFGFGLTYTTFAYANLSLAASSVAPDGSLTVTVDVTNTGATRARETVQLYVAAIGSRVPRAPQDLRAFGQVELDPAETQTVELTVPASDLAFYDVDASAWEVEAIEYEVRVGPHSADTPLRETFRVE